MIYGETCQQSVRADNGTRTICDRPLRDTARVCTACVNRMRATLARCMNLWPHVDAAVGRSLRLGGVPGTGTRAGSSAGLYGPWCASCDHESCQPLWKAASRNRNEPPIPNEEPLLLNPDALEDRWGIENTLTTWARLLSEETGRPVPVEPIHHDREQPLAAPLVADDRCEFSDLPISPAVQCACTHPQRRHP